MQGHFTKVTTFLYTSSEQGEFEIKNITTIYIKTVKIKYKSHKTSTREIYMRRTVKLIKYIKEEINGDIFHVLEKHLLYRLHQSLWLDHNKLWKILKEIGIPDHLSCLLRNLYAGQEATVRTGRGTTD